MKKYIFIAILVGFGGALFLDHVSNGLGAISAHARPLEVTEYTLMQPFAVGAEDDDTAQLHAQPTQSPQVTQHYQFLEPTSNPQQAGLNR